MLFGEVTESGFDFGRGMVGDEMVVWRLSVTWISSEWLNDPDEKNRVVQIQAGALYWTLDYGTAEHPGGKIDFVYELPDDPQFDALQFLGFH